MAVLHLSYSIPDDIADTLNKSQVEVDHEVYYVVAIRSTLVDTYKSRSESTKEPRSLDDLYSQGWTFRNTEHVTEVLFADNDYVQGAELLTIEDLPFEDSITCVVACPWPYEEDEKRFAGLIEQHSDTLREIAIDDFNYDRSQAPPDEDQKGRGPLSEGADER